MKFIEHAIYSLTSKEGYSSLFKAFITLATLYIVSISPIADMAIPFESHAYELKYTVEHEIKKEISSFQDLPCNLEMKTYKECKLAIYKKDLSKNALNLLTEFQKLIKKLAFFALSFSIVGFLAHPYVHKKA